MNRRQQPINKATAELQAGKYQGIGIPAQYGKKPGPTQSEYQPGRALTQHPPRKFN